MGLTGLCVPLSSGQDVGYPEFLNIRPYMSQSSGEPVTYGLYAVLVHSGYSCHAGHYYCYVKVRRMLAAQLPGSTGPTMGQSWPLQGEGWCPAGSTTGQSWSLQGEGWCLGV